MSTLFIADLHLEDARPGTTDAFLRFLRDEAQGADRLYILGDLFEAWPGDDAIDDPEDPFAGQIVAHLSALARSGTRVFVMHGNRDFLIGGRFCRETGATLLPDGTVVELYGERAVLLHGDALCTDDASYQRLRRIVRNPVVRGLFRIMTLNQRRALAARMRSGSRAHVGMTAPEIMDVNAEAVAHAFREAGVRTMIHGHTHRPAVHPLEIDGAPAKRIVLGDWYTQGSVLEVSAGGFELRALPR